jgi:hypothetical protein
MDKPTYLTVPQGVLLFQPSYPPHQPHESRTLRNTLKKEKYSDDNSEHEGIVVVVRE